MSENLGSTQSQEKYSGRKELLMFLFHHFKESSEKSNIKFSFEENLEQLIDEINLYYWEFVFFIKDEKLIVKSRDSNEHTKINIYKIISATELSIVKFQPIVGSRLLNAQLATFVAMYYYKNWFKQEINFPDLLFFHSELKNVWQKLLEDRIIWLTNVNTAIEFPFFLNSQVWMLIDLITRNSLAKNIKDE